MSRLAVWVAIALDDDARKISVVGCMASRDKAMATLDDRVPPRVARQAFDFGQHPPLVRQAVYSWLISCGLTPDEAIAEVRSIGRAMKAKMEAK